ncbi:MAG TPA: hypothetical protein VH763_09475 [Gemmatimonadales bacterium]|jgi:hypothetical protein
MRLIVSIIGAAVILSGCTGAHPGNRPPATERQRDSVIGASRLPGAQGVGRALRASDSANSRRALEDSIAREP